MKKAGMGKRMTFLTCSGMVFLTVLFAVRDAGAAEKKTLKIVDPAYKAALVVAGTPLRSSNGMNFDDRGNLLVAHIASSRISGSDPLIY